MTQEQFAVRKERAERDVFVITAAQEGWRVRSARNPSRFYLVSGDGSELQCTCPDFQQHAPQDPPGAASTCLPSRTTPESSTPIHNTGKGRKKMRRTRNR